MPRNPGHLGYQSRPLESPTVSHHTSSLVYWAFMGTSIPPFSQTSLGNVHEGLSSPSNRALTPDRCLIMVPRAHFGTSSKSCHSWGGRQPIAHTRHPKPFKEETAVRCDAVGRIRAFGGPAHIERPASPGWGFFGVTKHVVVRALVF